MKQIKCVRYFFPPEFDYILTKLLELQTHVAAMKASCDELEAETQLALTNELSKMLLERAGNLRAER